MICGTLLKMMEEVNKDKIDEKTQMIELSEWFEPKKINNYRNCSQGKNKYQYRMDKNGVYLYVEGTRNQFFMMDIEDLELLEKYTWKCSKRKGKKTFYVETGIKDDKNRYNFGIHNIIMDHHYFKEFTVDHIDLNGLNNRRYNLRLATKRQQITNQTKRIDNTTGIVGVWKEKNSYRSNWCDEHGKRKTKTFSISKYSSEDICKDEARKYRERMIKNLPHYH